MSDRASAEGFGRGLLVGVVIGVTVGILYAPRPGRVTTGLIAQKVREAIRKVERIIDQWEDKPEDAKEAKSKL